MLATVTAHNLHTQASWHDLALVAILEAHVLGGAGRVVVELPALVGALAVDLDDWAPGAGEHVCVHIGGEGVVDGHVTQRVWHVVGQVHGGRALFADTGLGAAEVAFARRRPGAAGVGCGRAARQIVGSSSAVTWRAENAVQWASSGGCASARTPGGLSRWCGGRRLIEGGTLLARHGARPIA